MKRIKSYLQCIPSLFHIKWVLNANMNHYVHCRFNTSTAINIISPKADFRSFALIKERVIWYVQSPDTDNVKTDGGHG